MQFMHKCIDRYNAVIESIYFNIMNSFQGLAAGATVCATALIAPLSAQAHISIYDHQHVYINRGRYYAADEITELSAEEKKGLTDAIIVPVDTEIDIESIKDGLPN